MVAAAIKAKCLTLVNHTKKQFIIIIITAPVVYSLKFIVIFNSLRIELITSSSSDCYENHPELRVDAR